VKILLVSNGFPPSGQWGTEYYTHQLATGLHSRGDEITVLYPVRDPDRPRFSTHREERFGIEVLEFANAGDPRKRFVDSYRNDAIESAFARLLREEEPDVVHFTHLMWGLSVLLPCVVQDAGIRTVATLTDFGLLCHRGQLFDWQFEACAGPVDAERCARCVREPGRWDAPPLTRGLRRLAVGGASRLGGLGRVVVSRDIEAREACVRRAREAIDHWILPTHALGDVFLDHGLDEERVSFLSYGIDEKLYSLPRPDRNGSGPRFVYMSQYMPHKGLVHLLEAVRILQARLPESVEPWCVDLHGNGCHGRHHRYAQELLRAGLPRRVVDRGPFEPLRAPEVMARTDCVVVPSLWRENAPLTVLQARAAGVPVIASDVLGVREVLEDGVHGILVPPGDSAALAEAMGKVIRREFTGVGPAPQVRWSDHLDAVQRIHSPLPPGEVPPLAALPFASVLQGV
jgi:glycosyltransferase involved in cell wall biosynthesis